MDIYTKVNKKVKADERMDMGCSKIWKGTTKIFKGIMCIYLTLTCGPIAGSVLHTTGIGSSAIKSVFGGMDIIEGVQDIYYGWNGDIDTETINYLKDVLGEKAYNNIEKYATITMDFTMFADFVLAVDSWVNGFGMLSGETEMAGKMAALESLDNVELAEIESVELANAETVTIETVEGEVVEIEAAAESGRSIGNVVNCNENSNKYISNFGKMSEEDAVRYDGYWKYQEALKNGEFKNGSIYDGWYKPDGTMNYPDNGGAIPGTEEIISIGNNNITELGRYGMPTGTSKYLTETGISADRLALPPTTNSDEYIIYRINGTIDNVERSVVAPWVGDKGLGIQYKLPKPIQWYIEHGILIPE